jgi:5-methylcytosine-specific restriction endonuclease McrA
MPAFNSVFVLDNNRRPLMPCHPARARELLTKGKAAVFRRYPFTVILKNRDNGDTQPVTLKIDPGSKITGMALINDAGSVLFAAELTHRGSAIKASLDSRRALRLSRRSRKTRYRQPRFSNRTKPKGWLPPSLMHRVRTTITWVKRLSRFCGITALAVERVKFDMQLMRNAEISGVEYQQGTLDGYSVREYLLEKWNRKCAYCSAENVPLQIEHIKAKANGGSNSVSNLALACGPCNTKKGTLPIEVFLKSKPDVLKRILKTIKNPLTDAAAVNATRNSIVAALISTGLPVETGTGAQTKFNRTMQGYPKGHWIDAACVGASGMVVILKPEMIPLKIKATGHGNRQMCATNKYGFPVRYRTGKKVFFGFQTGDMASANIPTGKYEGRTTGRVTVRAKRPSFTLGSRDVHVHPKYMRRVHRADGYCYSPRHAVQARRAEAA